MLNSDALILRADIAFVVRKVTCEQALHLGGYHEKYTRARSDTARIARSLLAGYRKSDFSRLRRNQFLSKRNNFTDVKAVVLKFNIEIQIQENARLT